MKAEIKEAWQRILAHQIEGIMLHSKLSTTYMLLDCKKQSRTHSAHYIQECITHQNTLLYIVSEYGEEVQPANLTIEPDKHICMPVRPPERHVRHEKASALVNVWKEWEIATVSFYEEMKAILPDCPMINKLLKSVKHELAHIH